MISVVGRRDDCHALINSLLGRVRLKSFNSLFLAYESDYRCDVVVAEAVDRFHVPEIPMVLSGADADSDKEGLVAVVAGYVYDRQVRRTLVSTAEVGSVAFCTARLIQHFATGNEIRILDRNPSVCGVVAAT